jgi:autotransporter translocation and assembly factor TamB
MPPVGFASCDTPRTRQEESLMKHVVMLLLAVVLFAAPAVAQDAAKAAKVDITGQWTMTVESPQGQMTITANYKQEGETLTGNHVSEMGEAPLKGTVKGNEMNYTLTMDMGGQQFSIVHKGKVDGDTITGTAELGDMGNMSFVAKRKK